VRRLNFTASERAALVAFLKTLTDLKFLTDPKFSDPFQ
jgi:cytochrome c peroxidase